MESQYGRIVAAMADLLAQGGFDAVSVRRVATRAGVSIGSVQHHFPTKDLMLQAANDQLGGVFMERLHQEAAEEKPPEERLRGAVLALVNPDPAHRKLSVLWALRMARAAVDEPTARRHRYDRAAVEKLLAQLLVESRPNICEEHAKNRAATLLAVADGLACAIVVEPARMPPERAVELIDAALRVALDERQP
ncbi:transcriptional regulator, TetR family [Segniliparus rotundus DSM 44985]|uniref:Transcriptional regulator, TetR family n=1 Tax=Segniliparus rotundus (strain ATCC BAA-972 / CDC 1076 / CIP 108378 / DSM 44985 / JCM 13578) TaxID=640132 RepID=D6ZFI6_SEGRD|nr:TetR/AcrR family transcriptional regulator [Segniliparus rotundus]ADG97710.1 transcriptional regulator, TetR family [Segniliparus rotundus DSM 44985]